MLIDWTKRFHYQVEAHNALGVRKKIVAHNRVRVVEFIRRIKSEGYQVASIELRPTHTFANR